MDFYKFFLKYGFVIELVIASALFVFSYKKRKLFLLRLLCSLFALALTAFLWNSVIPHNPILQFFIYTAYFAVATGGIMFCFKVNFSTALFSQVGAYATQHMAFRIGSLMKAPLFHFPAASAAVYVVAVIGVYAASFFLFARRQKTKENKFSEGYAIVLLSLALIVFTNLIQSLLDFYGQNLSLVIYVIVALYDMLCCVFTLCLQYGIFKSGKMREDYEIMSHLLHQQKQQMDMSKENIDLINVKCHDLKHQLSAFKGRLTQEEVAEMEKAVEIYDSSLKTGNETLDVVLAEKSLVCLKNRVKLDCIADGENLKFMSAPDIYALFGNALDNAIEAAQKLADEKNRLVSLHIKRTKGLLSVHVQNFFQGELTLIGGLPATTKQDASFHGFGMKSMKMLVDKYKGTLVFGTEDNIFNLNLIFPL